MKVIDGIELLRMIKNGEIKEKQRFTDGLLKLEYFDKTIKICRFSSDGTYDYYESDYEIADLISHKFTLLEEKELEEIGIQKNRTVRYEKDRFIESMLNHFYDMDLEVRKKLNEAIKEIKRIEKEGK